MNKQEFLVALKKSLVGIPQDDIAERINFYSEMIDDCIEDGALEEEAVAELGSIEKIAGQIMAEIPLTKLVKEKVKPGRKLSAWEIILLVLGSPIWLSFFIALALVIACAYVVALSLIISLWAIDFSLACCAISGIFCMIVFAAQGNFLPGIAMLGSGFICAGITIFGFFGCAHASRAILTLTKRFFIWIKSCFIKKEAVK